MLDGAVLSDGRRPVWYSPSLPALLGREEGRRTHEFNKLSMPPAAWLVSLAATSSTRITNELETLLPMAGTR
jgi:hypothetical protein